MKKFTIFVIALLVSVCAMGCQNSTESAQIVATTLPVYEFTSALCQGTDLTVTRLVTENISCLHDYSLQVKQMQVLESAELVVTSGVDLEAFLEDALHSSHTILDASIDVALLCGNKEHAHEHNHEGHSHAEDPHIWLSPENAKIMAHNLCQGLTEAYPQHSAVFNKNLIALNKKFDDLIRYADEQLRTLSHRELITFHDGFAYLAEAFDLTILHSIEEESGSEASAAELIELINIVSQHDVRAIFTEKNGSAAAASVIAAETDVSVFSLDMALSGDSYFTAMYHNIDTIKEALK